MRTTVSVLLASALVWASPALAQSTAPSPEIAALQAQIKAMQAQLDKLEAAQAAEAATATAPPPAAPVKPAAPSWTANTTISGKAFFNVSNIDQASDGADSVQSGTQADIKRFYIGVDHKFSDMFSANLTTDFRYNANGTAKDTAVYVKKAFLQARFSNALFIRVGAADMPWIPFAESLYGYRFVENTLTDRTRFGTSADWGVHAGGTFGNGIISYAVSAVNGAGYKTLSRSSDTIDLEGRISVNPIKPITLAVGAYSGKLGKSAANLPSSATPHTATRFNALAAYTDKKVRAGVEYFTARNWNNVASVATDRSDGWSTFGSFAFTPQVAVFGRYDWVRPSREIAPDLKDRYYNLGVNFKPIPPIDLALVYKRDRVRNGFLPTSNGTIGGLDSGIYSEIGLFGQFAF